MPTVVGYELDDETLVRFEYEPAPGFAPAAVPAGVENIAGKLRDAIDPALAGAKLVVDQVKALGPDQVEVKFGLKVSGEMNWWVSKAATDANFEITLTWNPAVGVELE